MKVTLSLTHNCNLACSYCYAGKKKLQDMTAETAFKAVDFAMNESKNGRPVHINFFGGEPFLCISLMKEVAAYARRCSDKYGKVVSFGVTTNGTLLSDAALEFIADSVYVDGSRSGCRFTEPMVPEICTGGNPPVACCNSCRVDPYRACGHDGGAGAQPPHNHHARRARLPGRATLTDKEEA